MKIMPSNRDIAEMVADELESRGIVKPTHPYYAYHVNEDTGANDLVGRYNTQREAKADAIDAWENGGYHQTIIRTATGQELEY